MAYRLSTHLSAAMLSRAYMGLGTGDLLLSSSTASCYGAPLADLDTVIAEAQAALCANPFTLSGTEPDRSIQQCYKNILDDVINNRLIFVSSTPCAFGF